MRKDLRTNNVPDLAVYLVFGRRMVERTISVHKDLVASAANLFKLRQKTLEITGRKSAQKAIAGPI